MLHSTGANNPELRRYVNPDDGRLGKNLYNNHWNMDVPDLRVCVHAFIGYLADRSVATYQVLPFDHRGWHCASGRNGSGNDTHLSVELCEDGLVSNTYFEAVYQEAVGLFAMWSKLYGWDPLAPGVIIDHAEGYRRGIASNHGDVGHWFARHGRTMDDFRRAVARELAHQAEPSPGREVWLWGVNGTYAQDFIVHPDKDGSYALEFVSCNKMLDVEYNQPGDGTTVQAWPRNNTDAQRWLIKEKATRGLGKVVRLASYTDPDYVLDVAGNRHEPGTRVQTWRDYESYPGGNHAQEFVLIPRGWTPEGLQIVSIILADANMAVDVRSGGH